MSDVLFINPPWPGRVSRQGSRFNRAWPPLDLLNCASMLRSKGMSTELLDFRARDHPWGLAAQRAREAGLVVLTSSPLDRWQCPNLELDHFLGLARQVDHPRLFITGAHGTLQPQRVLEACSAQAVVLGEPEATVADLAECKPLTDIPGLAFLGGGELRTTSARAPLDLTCLPVPALDLAPPAYYHYELLGERLALLETARGCRHSCAFCLKAMYGTGLRVKHPQQVEQEVRYAHQLGARRIYFIDLDFAAKRESAREVCARLTAAGLDVTWCCQCRADSLDQDLLRLMRSAGCRLIHLGVESGSDRLLKDIHKGLIQGQVERVVRAAENMGIATACFFLFGLPGETVSDRLGTAALARRLGATFCSFQRFTAYAGTRLPGPPPGRDPFARSPQPRLRDDIDRDIFNAYLRFYLAPRTILRVMSRVSPAGWLRGLRLLACYLASA